MLRVEHTACPVAFRLPAGSHGFGHRLEAVYVLLAVLVCFGQVFSAITFAKAASTQPSPRPEVFLTIHTFMFWINIFAVAIV